MQLFFTFSSRLEQNCKRQNNLHLINRSSWCMMSFKPIRWMTEKVQLLVETGEASKVGTERDGTSAVFLLKLTKSRTHIRTSSVPPVLIVQIESILFVGSCWSALQIRWSSGRSVILLSPARRCSDGWRAAPLELARWSGPDRFWPRAGVYHDCRFAGNRFDLQQRGRISASLSRFVSRVLNSVS